MLFRFTLAAFLATIVGLNLDVAPSQPQSRVSLHAVAVPQVNLASRQAPPSRSLPRDQGNVLQVHRPRSVPELFGGVAASETTSKCISKRSVPELVGGVAVSESSSKCVSKRSVPELFGGVAASETPASASASARCRSCSAASAVHESTSKCVSKRSVPELFAGTAVRESTDKSITTRAIPDSL